MAIVRSSTNPASGDPTTRVGDVLAEQEHSVSALAALVSQDAQVQRRSPRHCVSLP